MNTPLENAPIKLIIDDETPGDSVIGVRWTISKEMFKKIEGDKILKLYLLIIVSKRNYLKSEERVTYTEVSRDTVRLEKMMKYIRFSKSGDHRISATIIWTRQKAEDMWTILYKTHSRGNYVCNLTQKYEGTIMPDIDSWEIGQEKETHLDLFISSKFFAPDPPAWLNEWVNGFILKFLGKAGNECDFKKRCIFAFTLQPILLLIWIPFTILAKLILIVFGLILCCRNIRLYSVLHPFEESIVDIFDGVYRGGKYQDCNSIFWRDGDGEKTPMFIKFFILVLPFTLIVIITLFSLRQEGVIDITFGRILLMALKGLVFLVIGIFTACISWFVCGKVASFKVFENIRATMRKKRIRKEKLRRDNRMNKFASLISHGDEKADIKDLPEDKITIWLKFEQLKKKVCRQYSE